MANWSFRCCFCLNFAIGFSLLQLLPPPPPLCSHHQISIHSPFNMHVPQMHSLSMYIVRCVCVCVWTGGKITAIRCLFLLHFAFAGIFIAWSFWCLNAHCTNLFFLHLGKQSFYLHAAYSCLIAVIFFKFNAFSLFTALRARYYLSWFHALIVAGFIHYVCNELDEVRLVPRIRLPLRWRKKQHTYEAGAWRFVSKTS